MTFLDLLQPFIYAAFVIAVALPRCAASRIDARYKISFALGVFAALVVPVSGAPALGIPTASFYPLIVLSVTLGCRGASRSFFVLAICAWSCASAALTYIYGIPGELFSIESSAMISRLLKHGVAIEAPIFAVCGVALARASLGRPHIAPAAFAFSSFASVSLFDIDAAGRFALFPPISILFDMISTTAISLFFYLLIRGGHTVHKANIGTSAAESSTTSPDKVR